MNNFLSKNWKYTDLDKHFSFKTYLYYKNRKQPKQSLIEFKDRVNYVSITGLSNVTGIINPINKIAKIDVLAHISATIMDPIAKYFSINHGIADS